MAGVEAKDGVPAPNKEGVCVDPNNDADADPKSED